MNSNLYFSQMQLLLIIGYVWPEPQATAAGSRMLQIIAQFKGMGYQITFASSAQKPITAFDLSSIDVTEKSIMLNHHSFDEFLENLKPTVVLFDRFMIEEQYGWRVAQTCPNALRILDSEDLHFLRKARQQAVKCSVDLPTGIIQSEEAKREIASIYRCDVTLTISEFEMDYLKKVYQIPEHILFYLPFLVEVDTLPKPTFEERQDFIFVGNFLHAPNWDAVLQLKQHIWPEIKARIPMATMHVYGGYPTDKVFQLHNKQERFLIHGRVNDVNEVMQKSKVCLAPLRFGAGLKGKLIDAMQNKTPFVTTTIGAEGMFGTHDFEDSIAINNKAFVEKAVELYQNKTLWDKMSSQGEKVLKLRFEATIFKDAFSEKINEILGDLVKHRANNFMGSLLQHHTLKSSMYLSKWIAEKNKN